MVGWLVVVQLFLASRIFWIGFSPYFEINGKKFDFFGERGIELNVASLSLPLAGNPDPKATNFQT